MACPEKKLTRKIKFRIGPSRARRSGDDGSEATPPPPPPPPPRLPLVPPTSPSGRISVIGGKHLPLPRRLPPPSRADEDTEKVGEQDYEDWDEEEEDEELERSSENDFRCLLMSNQSNTPPNIVRHEAAPLNKHEYFSLLTNWRQLLAGKRTYLRSSRDSRMPNDVFRCPFAHPKTLGCQEPFSTLIHESAKYSIIQKKIKLLSEQYSLFRRPRRDGSSFYRAFLFSYLENIGQMHDSQVEFTRLMECVARCRDYFCCLKWDKAYFMNPEAYFSSVVSEFEHLVNLVANGLSADDLYKRNLQETMSSRTLSLLRLLTEVEIRAREQQYKPFPPEYKNALEFCLTVVRPMDVEAENTQIRSLSNALGIPLRVEVADASLQFGIVQVKSHDFFPRSESGVTTISGPVHSSQSYSSSGKTTKPLEQQRDNDSVEQARISSGGSLLSSDGIPLVTLLFTNGHYDILYK
ncbi:OVARIAN TUMOR DOMAIN-containing deubiquitinating enzyme 1-like isoform X2 [Phragmites australis]|uniref:OVARIAN TUMOR DOMAIN-containing deubiquitinating enzyme 1-like isoform X2 n=1 Tax=Phragmites australis TaxID=29695 RepID=UPI002D794E5C|nr:OVARIAN TUMOR DOMAIN-containing deubiquitinating enzyme 1-like isoform X2 [Phragmites australis]